MAEDVQRQMIGDPAHLAFEVIWPKEEPHPTKGLAWGSLVLWFAGQRHWTSDESVEGGPVEWTWIDLVEHLARAWGHLKYEENAPFGLTAEGPEELRTPGLLRGVPGKAATEVEDAVHAYQQRHDLAAGLKGIYLPALWLLREGNTMHLRASGRDLWRPLDNVLIVLERFVDSVRARNCNAPRAVAAFKAWESRRPSKTKILQWRTGLNAAQLKNWVPKGVDPETWWGTATIESSIQAAARLSQPLLEETRKAILDAIANLPSAKGTPELDALSVAAQAVKDAVSAKRPYEQGYTLALWLRNQLNFGDKPVDPTAILRSWSVHVGTLPSLEKSLDAVACWGPKTALAVLLNPSGKHAAASAGRHATLAHEIAHLLLDRDHQLPAAEVFGGSTPLHLEKRARAFAAELLLPREVAGSAIAQTPDLDTAVAALEKYKVSREVIGWQIRNGTGWELLGSRDRRTVANWFRRRTAQA